MANNKAKSHPNILYLHCHDAGRYIQPFGYSVLTPNLQRLAEDGVLFRKAFCGNPTCSPSRACLLTGQSAHSAGMLGLAHRGWTLRDYGKTLMNFLRGHGYRTALCGQQHIAIPPFANPSEGGYDEILTLDTDFEKPIEEVRSFLARRQTSPFFLDVGLFAPHRNGTGGDFPRTAPPNDSRYVMPPPTLPDNPITRSDFALYQSSIRSTDEAFGQVLNALEENNLRENTLVVCTTDHGIAFPHMKCRLTDHGLGVFLILRGPGSFSGGRVIDSLVSQIDIFPTICEWLGVDPPDWLEGKSFLGLANGAQENTRNAVFAEVNFHASQEPGRAVRTDRWKYIRRYTDYDKTILPNIDNSLSKRYLHERGLAERTEPGELLFDLDFDPQESCNLAMDPDCAELKKELAYLLERWMSETADPLLEGRLPRTEGIIETPPDQFDSTGGEPDFTELPPVGNSPKT
ncbi:MAG: sulfatase [Verrucomicrobiota bacterium]